MSNSDCPSPSDVLRTVGPTFLIKTPTPMRLKFDDAQTMPARAEPLEPMIEHPAPPPSAAYEAETAQLDRELTLAKTLLNAALARELKAAREVLRLRRDNEALRNQLAQLRANPTAGDPLENLRAHRHWRAKK